LRRVPETPITRLKNDMRVATETSHSETATVGVWIDAGSVYEDENTNGVAHFLEHMAFKGTGKRSREALEREVENMGASLNAYTSREQTVYYIKVFKNDVPKAVDILADIIQNSSYDKDHIERERGTILREMEEVASQPEETIFDHLHSVAYQGNALGRTILGPASNVQRFTRDDLINYTKKHYTGPRMVLAASGGVNHDQLVGLAENAFSSVSSQSHKPQGFVHPSQFTGSMVSIRDDDMPEVHVALAFESVGWSNPDFFTFLLLQSLLGSWDKSLSGNKNVNSKLCEVVATKGLAESFTTFNTCYNNTGLFGLYAVSAQPDRVDELLMESMAELQRLSFGVTEAELERTKNKLIGASMMHLDGTSPVCEDIGRHVIALGKRLSAAEVYTRIQRVTLQDIFRVAESHFFDTDPAIAAMGPVDDFPDWHQIRAGTIWNRP